MTNKNLEKLAEELKGYKVMKKEVEAEIERVERLLKEEMTNRQVDSLIVGNYSMTYKLAESHRFDSKGFKADYGNLYQQYYKPTSNMRFTFS